MSQAQKGSFASGASIGIGQTSGELMIPSGATSMKLSTTGMDASNTAKTQKSTNGGQTWADQTTYNSNQTLAAVTVAHGEVWRIVSVAQQAMKVMDYTMSVES